MKNSFFLLFLITLVFVSAQCEDDDINTSNDTCSKYYKPLPELTNEGDNLFGCIINNEEWVAYTDPTGQILGGALPIETDFNEPVNFLSILAKRLIFTESCDTSDESIIIHVFDLEENGINKLSVNTKLSNRVTSCTYNIDTLFNNALSIERLDTELDIISGVFNMTLISEDCNDTLKITAGRFDSSY